MTEAEFGICETTKTADVFELIFKVPQSGVKADLSFKYCIDVDSYFAYAGQDLIMCTDRGDKAPDVAGWTTLPTKMQRSMPLAQGSLLPPPNFWMEIAYNGDDREKAQNKIENVLVPQVGLMCSCVLIVLQRVPSDTYEKRMGRIDAQSIVQPLSDETRPAQPVQASAEQVVTPRPRYAPYIGCWPAGATTPTWYLIQRDLHLDIPVSGKTVPFRLNFNQVLKVYAD